MIKEDKVNFPGVFSSLFLYFHQFTFAMKMFSQHDRSEI